ncbi:thiol-disulfide oxidoreductase DCC family protein [Bacillus seohaeanensis]|jgi:predicted DCC family thiol-disulfide oxidoreductase YuxK|uniref:Thiol-disulfide oxidoreductase DCC family protein n=1 Tax=Bacillus seohaeanensis TaxID=284580 RepID=A0ABW5RTP0_9BACI
MTRAIILFDGICNLCNHSVQFIIKRDPTAYFQFASLQSDVGVSLRETYGLPTRIDSVVLIENNKVFVKSNAALHICKHLKGMWKLLFVLKLLPPFIRDGLYEVVAKNRYKWFGKRDQCMLPDQNRKDRFL